MYSSRMRLFVLFAIVHFIQAQDQNGCQTPLGDPGNCISIKECEGLVNLLRTQGNNPEVRSYLIKSTCGYSGAIPLVCCPRATSQFRTTSTTNAPYTQPPPVIVPTPPPNTNVNQPGGDTNVNRGADGLLRPPSCGFSNDSTTRVVGGVPANLGEFPWAVALGYRNNNNPAQPKWLCGGSLISDRHILTAAHCVHNRNDLYLARIGDLDLYSDNDGAFPENINIIQKKVHENYSPTTYTNDIAILTLEHPPTTKTVWPICIPADEPLRSMSFEKFNAFVAGWGALYFQGPSSTNLQKAFLPIVTAEQCKNAFTKFQTIIDERVLCAGFTTGGKDACQGDSGGPLMLGRGENTNKRFYQIGVVSYGFRCAERGYPGVYTRVTHFVDWIAQNTV